VLGSVKRLTVAAICALSLLGLGGCASLPLLAKKPEVKKVSVSLVGLDLRKLDLRFDVEVDNAGAGSLTVSGYDYDLTIEGRPFLKGESHASFELKPHAVTTVSLPVSIKLADLFRQLASLIGRSDAAYRMAAGVQIKTPFGAVRLPFQKEGRLPLFPSKRP
jgi:LEA14-like dessication related protein